MLGDKNVTVCLAVKDLASARKFYEEVLGLSVAKDMQEGGVLYKSGSSSLMVYVSEFAGTNQATAAAWVVDDVAATAQALKAKGVVFEHYDSLPNTSLEGDVHVMGEFKSVWFKDPAGNILNVVNGAM